MVIETDNPLAHEILSTSEIWDAHTHLGADKDGNAMTLRALLAYLRESGIRKAAVFPFDERHGSRTFHEPNERILEAHRKHRSLLIPFFRLNPRHAWEKEAHLRTAQGFRGIKLHPRSQNFSLLSRQAMNIYAFAEHHRLPILIHTGLGTENIARQALRIATKHPNLRLILGHAGYVDLPGVSALLSRSVARNVYVEISTLPVYDLYDLLLAVNPEKVIFGSDIPYADIGVGLEALVDVALMLGMSDENIRKMLQGNFARCLEED